jgi:hypothetical protein
MGLVHFPLVVGYVVGCRWTLKTKKEMIMNKNKPLYITLLVILMSWLALPAFAADKSDKNISVVWSFVPKDGKVAEFEAGFKKHIAYRNAKNDPRHWRVYMQEMGGNLDTYYVRFCCVSWADIDEYKQWSSKAETGQNWNDNVNQFIANYRMDRSEIDLENSNWANDVEFKYVGVTSYNVKLGHGKALAEDKKIMSEAAKAQNWPYHWSWSDNINGKHRISLAVPYKSYAEMAPIETKFSKILAKHLKSEKKAKQLLERWISHFDSISYNIYKLRDDL